MAKWLVVVAIVGPNGERKGSAEHEIERPDQASAIEGVLGRSMPWAIEQQDQLLIYAEPFDEGEQEDAEWAKQYLAKMDLPHQGGTPEDIKRWREKAQKQFDDVAASREEK